jgi:hypothetical protein
VSESPETVVHVVQAVFGTDDQRCADCGFLLRHSGSPAHEWPQKFEPGALVGVRIDTTFKDGFVVGYFPIGERELEDDERRCTAGAD